MGDEEAAAEEVALPGFRFHPTDQELVGFYLRRKVEKKPIRIDLIRQVDIYKYEPWDLPRVSSVGDKEWFFFCLRGRKYRNSIRPNRVTGSGFWKATGIDRPVHATGGGGGHSHHDFIGLKKSLVYYRGSAGKGTKTDWMMHEFRLPTAGKHAPAAGDGSCLPEAENWTICRIFKRAVPCNKNHHQQPQQSRQVPPPSESVSETRTTTSSAIDHHAWKHSPVAAYLGDAESSNSVVTYLEPPPRDNNNTSCTDDQLTCSAAAAAAAQWNPPAAQRPTAPSVAAPPVLVTTEDLYWCSTPSPAGEFAFDVDGISWDELGRVVEFAVDPSLGYSLYA